MLNSASQVEWVAAWGAALLVNMVNEAYLSLGASEDGKSGASISGGVWYACPALHMHHRNVRHDYSALKNASLPSPLHATTRPPLTMRHRIVHHDDSSLHKFVEPFSLHDSTHPSLHSLYRVISRDASASARF